jgi:TM2 domain-containing membrane protein YozV
MHYPQGNDVKSMMVYEAQKKNAGIGYILWFLFGLFGAHRFYLGKILSGVIQLVLGILALLTISAPFLFCIWAIWWVYDALVMPGWISTRNLELAQAITAQTASKPSASTPEPIPAVTEKAPATPTAVDASVEDRLEQLQNLLDKDLISFDEFVQRRDKILDGI